VFSQLLWFVFGIEDGQFCEHAHVRPLEAKGSLKQAHELIKESSVLVVLNKICQLVGMNNNVKTAHLSQSEL
jgi:hypothetical protein